MAVAARRASRAESRQHERHAQRHPHGEPAEKRRIGLAVELHEESEKAVAGEEGGGDQSRPLMPAQHTEAELQDREQNQSFEKALVQLARVSRRRQLIRRAREDHRPRHVRCPSPQFAVDEVRDAHQRNSDRRDAGDQIADAENAELAAAAEQDDGNRKPQHAAMERHAAFPHRNQFDRIGEESIRKPAAEIGMRRHAAENGAVEHIPADPAADDDAECGPHHEIADVVCGGGRFSVERWIFPQRAILQRPENDPPAEQDADDVGNCVPADRYRSQMNEDRVEARVGQNGLINVWHRWAKSDRGTGNSGSSAFFLFTKRGPRAACPRVT